MPELAYEEHKTCRYILNALKDLGIDSKVVAGTGIIADIDSGKKGVNIAVRADMDALPIEEKTGLEFSSTHPRCMHACGHDGHMAIVLGLAMVISKLKEKFSGKLRLIFQPAEEKPPQGGAKLMIEAGALKDMDMALGFHIFPYLEWGKAAVLKGPVMAAADEFEIKVKGSGGHASAPERTSDTILVAAKIIEGLNDIVSRMISPFDPVVISCGEIHGGYAFNVIPDEVVIRGTVRTFNAQLRHTIPEKMRHLIEGICRAYDAAYEMEYIQCYPTLKNDEKTAEFLKDIAGMVFGRDNVVDMKPVMGSEDFSRYLELKSGCYVFLGGAKKGVSDSLHSPTYDFDENVLKSGVLFLTKAVLNSSVWK